MAEFGLKDAGKLLVIALATILTVKYGGGYIPSIYTIPGIDVTVGSALATAVGVFLGEWVARMIPQLK